MPFTLRNLKEDLEDFGSNFDGAPDLEFRLASKALELERSGLSYQRIPPHEPMERECSQVRESGLPASRAERQRSPYSRIPKVSRASCRSEKIRTRLMRSSAKSYTTAFSESSGTPLIRPLA